MVAPRLRSDLLSNLRRTGVTVGYIIPVDNVPEGFDVYRATILVFQIIGLLPQVDAQKGNLCLRCIGKWAVLVRRSGDQ